MLYELLTGHPPFDGEAPISIALKHINEHPVPPGQMRPGIPPALEAVVMRSLEKDPARRYQTAEDFIAALEQARRAPTRQIVMEPTPGEPWVERRALALVGVGARRARVAAPSPPAPTSCWSGKKVTVPNLVGRDASDAAEILHKRDLEIAYVTVEDDKVPTNEVISQDPEAGEDVREGTTVTVKVSGGKGTAAVPDVVGQSHDDAEQAVKDAGFKATVTEAFSDSVPEGNVISVSPEPGSRRPRAARSRSRSPRARRASSSPASSATPPTGRRR